jgi:hypothetical protein
VILVHICVILVTLSLTVKLAQKDTISLNILIAITAIALKPMVQVSTLTLLQILFKTVQLVAQAAKMLPNAHNALHLHFLTKLMTNVIATSYMILELPRQGLTTLTPMASFGIAHC